MSDWPFDLRALSGLIAERGLQLGQPAHFFTSCDSTQAEAKRALEQGASHGALFVADHQTGGRGRQGRSWSSTPGESVLLSLLVRGAFRPEHLPLAALVTGLAVRAAVARAVPARSVGVKWPNDVLVGTESGPQKIAGILCEAQSRGDGHAIIIGVGVNVHTRELPAELNATSLALAGAEAPERATLVADILAHLDHNLEHVLMRGLGLVHAELAAHDLLRDQPVQSESGAGIARGIDEHGRLIVELDSGGREPWSSGEVHLRKLGQP